MVWPTLGSRKAKEQNTIVIETDRPHDTSSAAIGRIYVALRCGRKTDGERAIWSCVGWHGPTSITGRRHLHANATLVANMDFCG